MLNDLTCFIFYEKLLFFPEFPSLNEDVHSGQGKFSLDRKEA